MHRTQPVPEQEGSTGPEQRDECDGESDLLRPRSEVAAASERDGDASAGDEATASPDTDGADTDGADTDGAATDDEVVSAAPDLVDERFTRHRVGETAVLYDRLEQTTWVQADVDPAELVTSED